MAILSKSLTHKYQKTFKSFLFVCFKSIFSSKHEFYFPSFLLLHQKLLYNMLALNRYFILPMIVCHQCHPDGTLSLLYVLSVGQFYWGLQITLKFTALCGWELLDWLSRERGGVSRWRSLSCMCFLKKWWLSSRRELCLLTSRESRLLYFIPRCRCVDPAPIQGVGIDLTSRDSMSKIEYLFFNPLQLLNISAWKSMVICSYLR